MPRLLPPHCLLICAALMIVLRALLPGPALIAAPFNWLGVVVMLAGFAVSLAGERRFRRVGTNILPFNPPTLFISDGIYRYSRNPMYLGFVLFLAGLAVTLGTLTPWLALPPFVIVIQRRFIAFEERAMLQRFGADYLRYQRTTRRWL
jgi:protein-S-isoprenylcysteine O-methyltransferase Ste14